MCVVKTAEKTVRSRRNREMMGNGLCQGADIVRRLAVLTALGLSLLPALAAQSEKPVAIRRMDTGKEHLRRDEFGMALKSFSAYAALEPQKSRPYDLLACTYIKMDSLDRALESIARSQEIDADEQTGYFANWLSGIVLLRQDNAAVAESALAKAARGSPAIAGQRIARARRNTDSLFVGEDATEPPSEEYRLKLAELLLDECIDYQLFGEQPKQK